MKKEKVRKQATAHVMISLLIHNEIVPTTKSLHSSSLDRA